MKTIDNVTTTNLDLAMRMAGIYIDPKDIDKIIDIVELIEEKGDDTSIRDISKLQAEWDLLETVNAPKPEIIGEMITNPEENIKPEDLVQKEWYVLWCNGFDYIFKHKSLHTYNGVEVRINHYSMYSIHSNTYHYHTYMIWDKSIKIRKAGALEVLAHFPNEFDAK